MSFILIFFTLVFGRINSSLLGYEFLNTDEFVIGAKALRFIKKDFNIYEFDGDTSGLLNALFLTWPKFLNLDITYLSLRLSAVIILSGILYNTFKIISYNLNNKNSYILFLPLVLFFSFSKDPDFLHYTNELIACYLITLTYYYIFIGSNSLKLGKSILVSFLSGSVIFAKMQFFPVAALNIFILILREVLVFKKFRIAFTLFLVLHLPIIFLSIYYYLNNNFLDFFYNVIHYPLADLFARNSQVNDLIVNSNSLLTILNSDKVNTLFNHIIYNSVFHLLYVYFIIFLGIVIISNNRSKIYKSINYQLIIIISSIIFTLIISVGTGSVHRHYLIVLIPMVPIFLSCFIKSLNFDEIQKKIANKIIIIFSMIFLISLFFENYKFYSKNFIHASFRENNFNFYSPRILQHLKFEENDNIIVWGWKPEIYLLSNLSPASRDTINQKQIDFKSNRDYFRNRFMNDFNKNLPSLVIDYVKPQSYMFTSKENSIESFKELKEVLDKNYTKLKNSNVECPDYYMHKTKYEVYKNKIVNYNFKNNFSEAFKINDFTIEEEICDTAIIFNKNMPDKIILEIEDKFVNQLMILASKKNNFEQIIELKIRYIDKKIEYKKILIKKYPYWSTLDFKENNQISEIEIDVKKFKERSLGITELKFF